MSRDAARSASAGHARPGWPLKAYLLALTVVVVAAAAASALYERDAALGGARAAGLGDARYGAARGARDLASDLAAARTQVDRLAATRGIDRVLTSPSGCSLQFAGAGAFAAGHLDIVSRTGAVACSSLHGSRGAPYARAAWLGRAMRADSTRYPVRDPRTGTTDVLVTAPLAGRGAVVAFLDLSGVGPTMTATDGGPRRLSFVVTTANRSTALASSVDPQYVVGASLAATDFARAGAPAAHAGLDGVPALFASARVAGVGWHVFAGANLAAAIAAASSESVRELVVILVGLAVFLAALLVVYQRIARPIRELSAGVRSAAARRGGGIRPVSGPAEIVALERAFQLLLAAAGRELESASRLAAIAESSADAIMGTSTDATVTAWNSGAERMFGYRAEEIIGTSVLSLVPPDQRDEGDAIMSRLASGEIVDAIETERVDRSGRRFTVSVAAAPVRDATGTVTGFSAVMRDVTERTRAEVERRTLEARLRQSERLESLGQLAAGVAHDFNNLLAVILNYASFVEERVGADDELASDVRQIRTAAARAARLTRQLLILGRREPVNPEVLELGAVVAASDDLLRASLGARVEVIVRLDGPATVRADRGQLEQVLLNLAVNARDAMPDGGALTIETFEVHLDDDYCSVHPGVDPGRYAALVVSDTGIGMEPDVAARIFEPFFTTKPRGEGTGLGLATVYGIAQEYGGSVTVYSEPGIGTSFRVYLPSAATSAPDREADPAPPERAGGGETILVVEDEPAMLEVTARILRRAGYETLEAATAAEAVALASVHDFHLLLTDSVLPKGTGREVTDEIAQFRPGRPVVFTSGYSEDVLARRRILAQGATVLQKPFSATLLLDTVRDALAGT
ncbi:MAG TPA: PAS domain S-box protein [Acidimicrobiales bacterium]|nr:PAS domain S-box protein [Acidimicrobiales bacterium]